MIKLLSQIFIKNRQNISQRNMRLSYLKLIGFCGIALNILLFAAKLMINTKSNSISIFADALNNLSDAASSILILIGFKVASKKPDKAHPFGHGRMEYVSALIIAFFILLMAFKLATSSIEKLFLNIAAEFSYISVIVLIASIAIKLYMYSYSKHYGKLLSSASLKASSIDCLGDSLATLGALISIIISNLTDLNLDGFFGLLIAGFLTYSGIKTLMDTIKPLLGQAPSLEFVQKITDIVMSHDDIKGMHDLIVHDYGPGKVMISLHAEVAKNKDLIAIHDCIDSIEQRISDELDCTAVIHMDPVDADDSVVNELKKSITQIVKNYSKNLSIHDFQIKKGTNHTNITFDVIVPFDFEIPDDRVLNELREAIQKLDPTLIPLIRIEHPLS